MVLEKCHESKTQEGMLKRVARRLRHSGGMVSLGGEDGKQLLR